MDRPGTIVRQFGCPRAVLGRLAGLVMASRPSNRVRNRRTVERLDIQPDDRVLEVGHGPGLALAWAAARTVRGHVIGIDRSPLMARMAARRNARAIAAGRVTLHVGDVEALPPFDAPFDKVPGVNVCMFWPDPVLVLTGLRRVMRPGGVIALTFQPRGRGATGEAARHGGDVIAAALGWAGFADLRQEVLPLRPVDAVCVLGRAPALESAAADGRAAARGPGLPAAPGPDRAAR